MEYDCCSYKKATPLTVYKALQRGVSMFKADRGDKGVITKNKSHIPSNHRRKKERKKENTVYYF